MLRVSFSGKFVVRLERAGQPASPERAVGTIPIPSSRASGKISGLGVACPERVLVLERGDRMNRVGAPDRPGRRLGDAEVPHLAGLDQLLHRAPRLLDRRRGSTLCW